MGTCLSANRQTDTPAHTSDPTPPTRPTSPPNQPEPSITPPSPTEQVEPATTLSLLSNPPERPITPPVPTEQVAPATTVSLLTNPPERPITPPSPTEQVAPATTVSLLTNPPERPITPPSPTATEQVATLSFLTNPPDRPITPSSPTERVKLPTRSLRTTRPSLPKQAKLSTVTPSREQFIPYVDTEGMYGQPYLVLDFDSRDENSNPSTLEGRILERVLDESRETETTIAIVGIAGVGKTSILRGISSLDRVNQRFRDGVYRLSLGMDAAKRNLIETLSWIVQSTGGPEVAKRMRRKDEVVKVIKHFRSWFHYRKCLFMLDDVMENKEIQDSIIFELMRLSDTGNESKMLLTTRNRDIASRAEAVFVLEQRSESESRRIFMRYADVEDKNEEDEDAINEILNRCNGLPIFLGVAGRAVRGLSLRRGLSVPYHEYAQSLEENTEHLLATGLDGYPSLYESLKGSLLVLEETRGDFGFKVCQTFAEMLRRLSVLKKYAKAPMGMLQFLWELENERQAALVAREFERVGLAEVEFETRERGMLGLHSSVHNFAQKETRRRGENQLGHEAVVRGYSVGLEMKAGSMEWWHTSLEADGYVHGNLCWHLLGAGRTWELKRLLLSPQWAERQLSVNGLSSLEADFALGIKALLDEDSSMIDRSEKVEALRKILDAVVCVWPSYTGNFRELWFQVRGRLKQYGDSFGAIREYLKRIEMMSTGR